MESYFEFLLHDYFEFLLEDYFDIIPLDFFSVSGFFIIDISISYYCKVLFVKCVSSSDYSLRSASSVIVSYSLLLLLPSNYFFNNSYF